MLYYYGNNNNNNNNNNNIIILLSLLLLLLLLLLISCFILTKAKVDTHRHYNKTDQKISYKTSCNFQIRYILALYSETGRIVTLTL